MESETKKKKIQSILILNFTDTCGVHNLHGMPAVFSALCSAIFAYFATSQAYGDSLHSIFPAMKNASMIEEEGESEFIIGVRFFVNFPKVFLMKL